MKRGSDVDPAQDRAQARKSWPIRRFALGDEPADNLLGTTSAGQRLAMVAEVTERAWALSGRLLPSYPRCETPIRRVRMGGVPVEERPFP